MLIVLGYSNDDLVEKEKMLVTLGQLHLFRPVLLGCKSERLAQFGQLHIFRQVLLGWKSEKLAQFGQLHIFRPVLLGLENLSENLRNVVIIKSN